MGMALLRSNVPARQMPWENCERSAISFKFDVEKGFEAEVRVHRIPEGTCLCIEECIYLCCCTVVENVPVRDKCGCEVCTDCPETLCVGSGRYQMVLFEAGTSNPVVPEPGEILVTVDHKV